MSKVFLGDVHGEHGIVTEVCSLFPFSEVIQVGDFGLGFGDDPETLPPNLRFIRGNHDNKAVCRNYKEWIEDGEVEETKVGPMMFIGGAWSIDWSYRTPGRDWWSDEELNDYEFEPLLEKYKETKPVVMVTHDVPDYVKKLLIPNSLNGSYMSRTNYWLEEMFKVHKPRFWIHGHHHVSYTRNIEDTLFIGLGINSYLEMAL